MFVDIKRHYRYIKRYKQILQVLFKYGFGYVIHEMDLHSLLPFRKRVMASGVGRTAQLPRAERIRMVLEELGVTAIKFGQFLSTRADLVPRDVVLELRRLQDDAPRFSFEEAKKEIEHSLGRELKEVFKEFEETPIAAASIGQVHNATLKSGEKAIVKVQRPRVRETIEVDIEILRDLAKMVEKHSEKARAVNAAGLVEEFAQTLFKELDYLREGRNAERFRRNFKGSHNAFFPRVYWESTSKNVLTMERIHGKKLTEIKKTRENEEYRKRVVENGGKVFLKMVLSDGFFHADPHQGNLFIGEDARIGFLDFGMVGYLDRESKRKIARLFEAMIQQNADKTFEKLADILEVKSGPKTENFKRDTLEMLASYYGTELKSVRVEDVLGESLQIANEYGVRFPPRFLLLSKALFNLEGIGRELYPEFNLVETAEPIVVRMALQRLSPKALVEELAETMQDFNEMVLGLPRRINVLLGKAESGELEIAFEHRGLERMIKELDVSANRLGLSMIISAVFIGSSLIILSGRGPKIMDISFIGIVGYAFCAWLGLILIYSILKSGRV